MIDYGSIEKDLIFVSPERVDNRIKGIKAKVEKEGMLKRERSL